MGSLSWSLRPSGPSPPPPPSSSPPPFVNFPNNFSTFSQRWGTAPDFPSTSALNTDRSVVKYLGDTFLLPDGCPVNDPMVQRFYKLCLESHQNAPLCTKERLSRVLTIPYVTNVCSAI